MKRSEQIRVYGFVLLDECMNLKFQKFDNVHHIILNTRGSNKKPLKQKS